MMRTTEIWISGLAAGLVLLLAGGASATVTLDYILTPNSKLVTSISSAEDFLTNTGEIPHWIDGASATPPVSYGGDTPVSTLNILRVEFTDDGFGSIIDGPVTITLMDWFHKINAGIAGSVIITGVNDATVAGATGSMVGGVVASWSTDLTGLIHNELYCEDEAATLCGTLGLPADMTTSVVHDGASVLVIDTAAVPDVASLPMTFSVDYSSVTMEMTIDLTLGRQYYYMEGEVVVAQVPGLNTAMQLVVVGLIALAGGYLVSGRRIGAMMGRLD